MSRVFINGSILGKWIEKLIPKLEVEYTVGIGITDATLYKDEKKRCDVHLYVITANNICPYNIAELIDTCHDSEKAVVFCFVKQLLPKSTLEAIYAIAEMVDDLGGLFISCDKFTDEVAQDLADSLKHIIGNE